MFQLFSQIENRLQQLELVGNEQLKQFLNTIFKPLYLDVKKWSQEQWQDDNLLEELPKYKQTLSPSDFGFQNMLVAGGKLQFLDFEYSGWDDPAKLISDFACHPEYPVIWEQARRFGERVSERIRMPEVFKRAETLLPLYRLKWCCILLNEFPIAQE